MTPKLYWLRWIAVLPGAICAYLLGNFTAIGFLWLADQLDQSNFILDAIGKQLAAAIAAFCFIHAGTSLAPFYKKSTALILMVLFILISGFTLFPNIMKGNTENIITLIVEVVVVVFYFIYVKNETPVEHA